MAVAAYGGLEMSAKAYRKKKILEYMQRKGTPIPSTEFIRNLPQWSYATLYRSLKELESEEKVICLAPDREDVFLWRLPRPERMQQRADRLLAILSDAPEPVGTASLMRITGWGPDTIRKVLRGLADERKVQKTVVHAQKHLWEISPDDKL